MNKNLVQDEINWLDCKKVGDFNLGHVTHGLGRLDGLPDVKRLQKTNCKKQIFLDFYENIQTYGDRRRSIHSHVYSLHRPGKLDRESCPILY
jgi:hypothetical protein